MSASALLQFNLYNYRYHTIGGVPITSLLYITRCYYSGPQSFGEDQYNTVSHLPIQV